jgi:hypothetical protein
LTTVRELGASYTPIHEVLIGMSSVQSQRTIAVAAAVLCSLLAACGSDTASPPAAVATAIEATSSLTQSATVGTAATAPTVKAVTASGAPVPGVAITFTATGGGSLGSTSVTTGADGVASTGSWTLGTTAGANTVTATAAGLTPVTFTATGVAGAATSAAVSSGNNQSTAVGTAVATPPAIVLKDQYANPVAGAAVTFSVDLGGGTVTGGTATTGADGIAKVGSWTLGITAGAQRLKAAAGSLNATFDATGTVPTGCTVTNYAVGATLPLAWDADDCVASTSPTGASVTGKRYDRLQFTTTAQQQIDAAVTGANGRTLLLRNATTGLYVGLQPGTAFSPSAQNPMHLKYVIPAGTWVLEPYAPDAATTGAYTLTTTANTKVDCDYIVFGTPGVTIADSVVNTTYNCTGPTGFMEQWVNLQLRTGMKIRLTLTSDFPALFLLRDDRQGPSSPTLVTKQGTAGQTLVIDWTATFDSWHEIIVAPLNAAGGRYTLKIEELP